MWHRTSSAGAARRSTAARLVTPVTWASQRVRKRIEEAFGWSKDSRPLRKRRVRGFHNAGFIATLTLGCHTLLRAAKLLPESLIT